MAITKVTGMMRTSTKGGDIASASPTVIDTDGDYFDVTGTTSFTAFTVAAGRRFTVQFDGVLTMTHHATTLDLPGGANITTAAGDVAEFFATGTNTVQCINYTKADGTAVVAAGGGITSATGVFTRDQTAATGSVAYTGVGFQPTVLFVFAAESGSGAGKASWGFTDSRTAYDRLIADFHNVVADSYDSWAELIRVTGGHPVFQKAVHSSYDVDGFTLAWTKAGSPTGTLNCVYLALK